MLKIFGASDDLVEIEGDSYQEINCYNKVVKILIGWDRTGSPQTSKGLYLFMRYSPPWNNNGCWSAEVAPIEEGAEIPWPVKIQLAERGYSIKVLIDCPVVPISWKTISF